MALRRLLILAWLTCPAFVPCRAWAEEAPALPPLPTEAHSTATRLFAAVEDAWVHTDTDRLTSLLDTTMVRIALKPGAPLTSALTRIAASFLVQDQLRLVHTRVFQVTRLECDKKQERCRALAEWTGDWGGRLGRRSIRVALTARPRDGQWLLTEIRAED